MFHRSKLRGSLLTGDKQKRSNIMIQSNESTSSTVIKRKQINSSEIDGPWSIFKGQDTRGTLQSRLYSGTKKPLLFFLTLELLFQISPDQWSAARRITVTIRQVVSLQSLLKAAFRIIFLHYSIKLVFHCFFPLCNLCSLSASRWRS